jgi:acetyl-CoA acetyltransferase
MATQGTATDIVILSAVRTPFGTFGGTLREISAVDLTGVAATAAIERAGIEASDIGHSVFGNVIQSTTDTVYFARHVALKAGLPIEVPGLTVNRLCGSGLQARVVSSKASDESAIGSENGRSTSKGSGVCSTGFRARRG